MDEFFKVLWFKYGLQGYLYLFEDLLKCLFVVLGGQDGGAGVVDLAVDDELVDTPGGRPLGGGGSS